VVSKIDPRPVAVFGAAFDPPHPGHLDLLEQLVEKGFRRIIVVPSFAHPFGKRMAPYELRVEMVRLLTERWLLQQEEPPELEISTIESDIAIPGRPVYTWDLLNALQERESLQKIHFAIGPDNLKQWHSFHRAEEIERKFGLAVVEERINLRSSDCRTLLAGKSPDIELLLPPELLALIDERNPYRD
jgi:nicotinate-nucleotide adenylyltransferase